MLSCEELLTSYVGVHCYGLQFCKTCGSTLCTVFKDDVIQVSLGCVNGNPYIEIVQHIFVGSKASWEVMPQGVVHYEEGPPESTYH
jgi:hypothetical protein